MSAFVIVSVLQGFFILVDEFFFHRRRGLPRWERIGHPIDTATVIACLLFLYFTEPTQLNTGIYYVLAIISCLCVTKDEWVHIKVCTPAEMWLHAVLFMLHPFVLFTAMNEWQISKPMFLVVGSGVGFFFVYQVVYWNFIEAKLRHHIQESRHRHFTKEELYEYFGE